MSAGRSRMAGAREVLGALKCVGGIIESGRRGRCGGRDRGCLLAEHGKLSCQAIDLLISRHLGKLFETCHRWPAQKGTYHRLLLLLQNQM